MGTRLLVFSSSTEGRNDKCMNRAICLYRQSHKYLC